MSDIVLLRLPYIKIQNPLQAFQLIAVKFVTKHPLFLPGLSYTTFDFVISYSFLKFNIMILNKKLLVTSIALLAALLTFNAMGQTTNSSSNTLSLGLQEVSMIHGSTSPVNLTLTPQSAGMAVKPFVSDSSARVLTSSVITGTNTRTMSVVFTGTLPGGTYLTLQAKEPNASFIGEKGTIGGLATYTTSGGA